MSTADLVTLIKQVNRQPVERDTLYHEIRDYSNLSYDAIVANPLLN